MMKGQLFRRSREERSKYLWRRR